MSADDTRRRSGYGPRDLHRAVLHHGGRAYQVAVESESLVLRQPHARADRAPITVATARLDETRHAIVRFEWDTEMAPADRPALAPLRAALEDVESTGGGRGSGNSLSPAVRKALVLNCMTGVTASDLQPADCKRLADFLKDLGLRLSETTVNGG